MNHHSSPDFIERVFLFGFGFVIGGTVSFFVLSRWVNFSNSFWVMLASCALVCGLLAVRYGDEFYRRLIDWFKQWGG